MKIVTWNVNSVRVRLTHLLEFLERHRPEVMCLQELKVPDDAFPRAEVEGLGYHVQTFGQKTYNGVAILSSLPMEDVRKGLPGAPEGDDEALQRRCIAARIGGVQVINVYVPNGQAPDSDKFFYKLAWLARLRRWLDSSFDPAQPLALVGDFNVAPEGRDVWDPATLDGQICFHPEERKALARLLEWGMADGFRHVNPDAAAFTWWDYRQAAFRRNLGMRIDHLLLSAPLLARCTAITIDLETRRKEQPSDHAPVIGEFTV